MIKMIFENYNDVLILDKNIVKFKIRDRDFLIKLILAFKESDDDFIRLYINDEETKLSKAVLFIDSFFELDCNDKKSLTKLYANLKKNMSEENEQYFGKINEEIKSFFKSISNEEDGEFIYDEDVDTLDLLKLYSFRYKTLLSENLLSFIVGSLIKINNNTGTKIFITYYLLDLFSKKEIDFLIKELRNKDIFLVDICFEHFNLEEIKQVIFDNDFTII